MEQYKMSENYNFSDYLFPHGTINGVPVPFYTTPEFRDEIREKFKLREDDIFVVTYPKSGTTWLQSILKEMLYAGEAEPFSKMTLAERLPWTDNPNSLVLDAIEQWPSPRAFKCHHSTPEEMDDLFFKGVRNAKIIYVLRDPRDVSVSLYHHLKKTGISTFLSTASFDEFHQKLVRDDTVVLYGLWENHLENWLSKRDEYSMLVLKYEDLIEDSAREIGKVAKFIGLDLPAERISAIAEKTSFSSAKKRTDMFGDDTGLKNSLLRKGVVGDWVNNFQDKQEAEKMGNIAKEIYNKYGL